jgi:glucose-6-phosphate 1-dehydrogenase
MKNLILFGASGDLAKEKLFPALYENFKKGFTCRYIGYGRTSMSNIAFKKRVKESIGNNDKEFLSYFSYITGDYSQNDLSKLTDIGDPSNTIYYLAIPNRLDIVKNLVLGLKENELITKGSQIVIEKPFGEDYKSAKNLIDFLKKEIGEERIYPIDHYLAKDLVRNLITLRFANPIFENLWDRKYIEKIDIDIKEKDGIKKRGSYYDTTGAIKDMIQNHGLQLLSLITFNQPKSFNFIDFHQEKEEILKNIILFNNDFDHNIEIGQYKGYKKEKYVDQKSNIETFAKIKIGVNNKRWKGVPITITTGKKLNKKETSIKIYFKPFNNCLWGDKCDLVTRNILTINIFPKNDIRLSLNTEFKPNIELPKTKDLIIDLSRDNNLSLPYSNALEDIYNRDKSYIPSFNEILESWSFIDEIEDWLNDKRDKLLRYY